MQTITIHEDDYFDSKPDFACKDIKDSYVLWDIDESGTVVGERIFPKETFPDAQLAFLLGNWINENNIKPEEMAICQVLINECKREGITLKDVVAISVCTDNFKVDTTCTNASIANEEDEDDNT